MYSRDTGPGSPMYLLSCCFLQLKLFMSYLVLLSYFSSKLISCCFCIGNSCFYVCRYISIAMVVWGTRYYNRAILENRN